MYTRGKRGKVALEGVGWGFGREDYVHIDGKPGKNGAWGSMCTRGKRGKEALRGVEWGFAT